MPLCAPMVTIEQHRGAMKTGGGDCFGERKREGEKEG